MRVLKDAPVGTDGRRLLLLSFHFPPAETAGALRWQRLSEPLAERGWSLDVITNDRDTVTDSGRRALEALPLDTRVFAVPEGQAFARKYSKVFSTGLKSLRSGPGRKHSAVSGDMAPSSSRPGSLHNTEIQWRPFAESGRRAYGAGFRLNLERSWARAAERLATHLIAETKPEYEAVITCGPPHLVHMAGLRLHRQSGIPLVIDMRDPWRFVERLPEPIASPVWLGVSRFLEERCIREATLVIANTEPAAELLRRTYPGLGPIITVRNGSDSIRTESGTANGPFVLAFAGSIYLDRDPRPLFEAAARLASEHRLAPSEFRLVLVGNVGEFNGLPVRSLAESAGIGDHVEILASVPRAELESILGRATMLVSLPQDSNLAIPSKIYEYAEYAAWMLAISDSASATGRLLSDSGADLVPPGSSDAIFSALDRRYRQFAEGERPRALAEDPRFHRSAQAERLAEALDTIAGRSPRQRSTSR